MFTKSYRSFIPIPNIYIRKYGHDDASSYTSHFSPRSYYGRIESDYKRIYCRYVSRQVQQQERENDVFPTVTKPYSAWVEPVSLPPNFRIPQF